MRTLTIISAGLSSPSSSLTLGLTIARAVAAAVEAVDELTVNVVELRDLAFDLAHCMTNHGAMPPQLAQAVEQVRTSDAIVAVTPVYKASYSGLFKMFFDALQPHDIRQIPVIIAANAGSQRHALVLEYAVRPLFSYLKAAIVPTAILVTPADRTEEQRPALEARIQRAANELAALMLPEEHSTSLTEE